MRKILAVVFFVDSLIGPLLLLGGWLAWIEMERDISEKWNSFVSSAEIPEQNTANHMSENAAPLVNSGTTETKERVDSVAIKPQDKGSNGTTEKGVLDGIYLAAERKLLAAKDNMGQIVGASTTGIMSFVADTSAWKTLTALANVAIQLVEFLKSVFVFILAYFVWRLTKISQLVRAYYLFRGRETPSQIMSALS